MTRAQPLGAFPLPAGFMLVPDDGGDPAVAAAAGALLAGRLPADWPAALRAHELAHAGDVAAAAAALSGDDPVTRYNRYLLAPGDADPDEVAAALPPLLAPLVEVLRYVTGERAAPPVIAPGGACAVVRALALAAQASDALDRGRAADAVALLQRASEIAAPEFAPLAAVLRGNAGTIGHEHGLDRERAREDLRAAAAALSGTDLLVAKAELHHELGVIAQEDAAASGTPPQPAMHEYYTALQLVTEQTAPALWASAQLGLATAYLSSPMGAASDKLRTGIAIQGIRAALRVFTQDEHPALWASATLNLANALTYAPSGKQGDNLVEAVELYDAVLALRERGADPVGRARVLANQGNALAHLGIFDEAKAKLHEARFLFEEQLDHGAVLAVRSVLDEIAKRSVPAAGHHPEGRLALGGTGAITARLPATGAGGG